MFGLKNKILGILKSIKKIENKAAFQATVACAVRVAAAVAPSTTLNSICWKNC